MVIFKLRRLRNLRAFLLASVALTFTALSQQARAACDTTTPCVTGPTNLGTTSGSNSSTGNFISSDGSVVAGALPGVGRAFVWSNGVMTDIGTLSGSSSIVGISANGATVAGNSNNTVFTWTSAGGIVALQQYSGGNFSVANAISADGTTVVGYGNNAGGSGTYALRWVNGVASNLGSLGGFQVSIAYDVNANGSVIVGYSYAPNDNNQHAFRWFNGVMSDIGSLGIGGDTYAQKVSADGSTVVGISGTLAFRWNNGVMIPMSLPGAAYSDVAVLTPDGSTVIGTSDDGAGNNPAYRWKNGVVTNITPTETTPYVFPKGVSNNGEVVVGYSGIGFSLVNTRAWRWTAATGEVYLNTLLANAGVNMTGINLRQANAISGDGQYIAGTGIFNGATRAYLLRYDDGAGALVTPIAGITTPESQQQSVTALANQRTGLMAQEHGLAAQLLGGDRPSAVGGEAGVHASGGSASAGGNVRYTSASGFSILAGAAWAREDYASAELKNSWIGGAALQYVHDGFSTAFQPLVEAGGWYSPRASLSFSRRYDNGAGTATGMGNTRGDLSYIYGRAGVVIPVTVSAQFVVSGEYGKQKLKTDPYAEDLAGNPFNAVASGGADSMDVFKARVQGSRDFGKYDMTLWAAYANGFNRSSTTVTTVAGLGSLTPSELKNIAWVEYGARLGYKITNSMLVDVFANGVSGGSDLGTRIHGGVGLRMRF